MASNTYPQYISGRARTVPPLSADPRRYSFLGLSDAEPNLGAPTGNAASKYFLLSEPVSGARYWSNANTIAVSGSYVGVGTDIPNEKLTVVGNLSVTGIIYGDIESLSGGLRAAGSDTQVQFNSAGNLQGNGGFTYNYNLCTITVGQNNFVSASAANIIGRNIAATVPNYLYVNNLTATDFIYASAFYGGGIYIQNGNSGFGTNAPNEKLTVVGNISATGSIFGNLTATAIPVAAGEDTYVQFNSGNSDVQAGSPALAFLHALSSLKVGGNQSINSISFYSSILGGSNNIISNTYATIGGGRSNVVSSIYGTIAGGRNNQVGADYNTIGGGIDNVTGDTYAGVAAGWNNNANGYGSFIGGGILNTVNGFYTVVAGGCSNTVNADCAGALGGVNNSVQHTNSFVIGSNLASSTTNTTFVNNLSTPGDVSARDVRTTNIHFTNGTLSQTATATDVFLTLTVGGSSLALPLFKI